ncbi:hypothetical protein MRB53_025743 [Persea americana]|uniref:Uncharacterized protein n=1 Tax=Persea americana TaxID=3435 RepID=A0ACC2LG99_PERAE|nr:hypothetical protein MRB53_025743 [Persea americana]
MLRLLRLHIDGPQTMNFLSSEISHLFINNARSVNIVEDSGTEKLQENKIGEIKLGHTDCCGLVVAAQRRTKFLGVDSLRTHKLESSSTIIAGVAFRRRPTVLRIDEEASPHRVVAEEENKQNGSQDESNASGKSKQVEFDVIPVKLDGDYKNEEETPVDVIPIELEGDDTDEEEETPA